jgi:hypothetical protein
VFDVFWGLKPEHEPLTPEGAAAQKRLDATPDQWPHTQCLPASIPADLFVLSVKIVQAPREIVMATEIGSPLRQIYTDGRELPKDPEPTYMGYSTGKWEGDTLVVETAGFRMAGSMALGTRAASRCASRSGIIAAISDTWTWNSLLTTPSTTRNRSR